jgi:8-oxo-dGTP pyrophosphatase MutT (NUDIX family)
MVKLYVHNKPLFLVEKIQPEIEEYLHRRTTIFIDELNLPAVKTILQELSKPEIYAGVLLHPNTSEALQLLKEQFIVITAAGGLVKTKNEEVLLIFRRGKWDLPKGKLDEGEDIEACAVREIEEETGLQTMKIDDQLLVTYHSYHEGEEHILKESHWYLMTTDSASILKPQTEEDIEKCEWVAIKDLPLYVTNMHASIVDVLEKALENMS